MSEEKEREWGNAEAVKFARWWSTWPADERRGWCRMVGADVETLEWSPDRDALARRIRELASWPEKGRSMADIVSEHMWFVAEFERLSAAEGCGVFMVMKRFNETESWPSDKNIFDFKFPELPGGGLDDLVPVAKSGTSAVMTVREAKP